MKPNYDTCPYRDLPAEQSWTTGVAAVPKPQVNPSSASALRIGRATRIATAGSCFAQNLARALVAAGFNYYCTEAAPPWLSKAEASAYNYGVFSSRYGNIYTTRQLRQLFQRALGQFTPQEPAWVSAGGRVSDPFRPRIMPRGFSSIAEMEADRAAHLAAVRRMMETLDVLVFTLGLTEAWHSRDDGAVFPVAPGCGAGIFDQQRHEFRNFRALEVADDLLQAIQLLRTVNPSCHVLLTVSPVALQATMEPQHVMQSTVYSKSVLRVAAAEVEAALPDVHYFPSYEIVTATGLTDQYFASDRRNVTDAAVQHVMRCFFATFTDTETSQELPRALAPEAPTAATMKVVCDEDAVAEALAASRADHR